MKTNWQTKKLGEVCDIKPPKKEARDRLNGDDLVSFVPMEDLGILTKNFIATKERPLKEVSGSYTYFSDNDVLLAKITPCFENGKIGIARNLKNGIGFGSSEYIVFRSRGELIPDYLYYYLARDQFRQDGKKVMTGAVGHKRVPKDFIESQIIPYPKSLPEQKRIVAILDEAFAAIATAKQNAEKNLQNARELFESYLQSVFANLSDGWEEKKLGEVLQKTETINPTQNPDKEFTYIDVSSVDNKRFIIENTTLLKGINAPSRARKHVKKGDVIFATVRPTLRRIAIIPKEYDGQVCSTGYFVLRAKEHINNKLLFYFLLTNRFNEKMEKLQKGASYPAVTDNEVREQVIHYPKTIPDQRSIVAKLDALSTETKKLEAIYQQKLADLDELKKSVLQKAFNGGLA